MEANLIYNSNSFSSDFGIRISKQEQNRKYTHHYDIGLMSWMPDLGLVLQLSQDSKVNELWPQKQFTELFDFWLDAKQVLNIHQLIEFWHLFYVILLLELYFAVLCGCSDFIWELPIHCTWGSAIMEYQACFDQPKKRIFWIIGYWTQLEQQHNYIIFISWISHVQKIPTLMIFSHLKIHVGVLQVYSLFTACWSTLSQSKPPKYHLT